MPETEEAAANVVEALRRVMRDLPGIGKDTKGAQYAYRGIEQITKEAQPLLAQHGVVFAPRVTTWQEPTQLVVNGKPWTDERIEVTYRVYGPGGIEDFIEVTTVGIGRDNSDKGANKCMTQALKYALIQTLCISDSKDDADGTTHEADTWSREESGEPYRRATLRAVANPADVDRMRPAELTERLATEGLDVNGTAKDRKARLAAHLAGVSQGMPSPTEAPEAIQGALVDVPADGACYGCGLPIPEGDLAPADQLGVEDDDGRVWHAGCKESAV